MLVFSTVVKLIAILSYLILELLTLRSKATRSIRIRFSTYVLGMLFWQFTSLMVNFSQTEGQALLWYNLLMAGTGAYCTLFFPFTRAFLFIKKQRVLTILAYSAWVFVLVIGILGLLFKKVVWGQSGYFVPVMSSRLVYVTAGLLASFWAFGIFNLIRALGRENSPVQRNRIFYVLLGAATVCIGGVSNFTKLQDYPVDSTFVLLSALITGYAVVRYRLLDIRIVLVRSLLYSVLTGALIVAYLGIVFGLESLLKQSFGYTGPTYAILAILILALVFLPLRNSLQKALDRVFFREKSDYQNAIQTFSRAITSLYDTEEILNLVGNAVVKAIKAGNIFIALLDGKKKAFTLRKHYGREPLPVDDVSVNEQGALARWLQTNGQPLVREEAFINPDTRPLVEENRALFQEADVSLVVPIILKDRLMGTLNLGAKLAGTMYNVEDLRFLATIANQTATALEKSDVYREIQRRLSEQTLLFILSEKFRSSPDFDSVMMSLVQILKNFLNCNYCALVSFEGEDSAKTYALDFVSQAAAEIGAGLRARVASGTVNRDAFPFSQAELERIVRQRQDLNGELQDIISSLVYLPLQNGSDLLGMLILSNRSGGTVVEERELELLRTILAIISQGVVLYRTIVNLMSVKTYNENILNSLNDMGDTLVILDLKGVVKSVNRATCERLGYREEELVGAHVSKIAGAGESLFGTEGLTQLISTGSIANCEMTYHSKAGKKIPMLFSGSVMMGEDGKTREIVGIARDITEHLKAEEMSKNLLLIKEIHHRIKNNLQVISSLLYLQSGYVKDEKTREMFKESQNRVRSMALLHEKLYQSHSLAGIDFAEYIRDLTRNLFTSYGVPATMVDFSIDITGITLGMDTAVPCGLIINELVSNALKHAFPDGRSGEVRVEMKRTEPPPLRRTVSAGEKWFQLVVRDNGKGFPTGVDFRAMDTLGLKLVSTLTEQLGGTIDLESNGGTWFIIQFKEL